MKHVAPPPPPRTPGKARGRVLTPEGVTPGGEIELTLAEYHALPPHPFQRDTKGHIKRNKFLRTYDVMQSYVEVCRHKGKLYKCDGHTRDDIWMQGLSDRVPEIIHARVWNCATREDLKWCYEHFDNQAAAENSSDKLASAIHASQVEFKSEFLIKHGYSSGLSMAEQFWSGRGNNTQRMHELFGDWLDELKLFDRCGPTQPMWQAPFMAGALIVLRVHDEAAVEYFTLYQQQAGSSSRGAADAIQALVTFHQVHVKAQRFTGESVRSDIVRAVIEGYEAHARRDRYTPDDEFKPMRRDTYKKWLLTARTRLKK